MAMTTSQFSICSAFEYVKLFSHFFLAHAYANGLKYNFGLFGNVDSNHKSREALELSIHRMEIQRAKAKCIMFAYLCITFFCGVKPSSSIHHNLYC